jgi:hypothetical protein
MVSSQKYQHRLVTATVVVNPPAKNSAHVVRNVWTNITVIMTVSQIMLVPLQQLLLFIGTNTVTAPPRQMTLPSLLTVMMSAILMMTIVIATVTAATGAAIQIIIAESITIHRGVIGQTTATPNQNQNIEDNVQLIDVNGFGDRRRNQIAVKWYR